MDIAPNIIDKDHQRIYCSDDNDETVEVLVSQPTYCVDGDHILVKNATVLRATPVLVLKPGKLSTR